MKILNVLQNGIPITEHPFNKIADDLGIEPEELIHRIEEIKKTGFIRRIGAIFNSTKMGYHSTLVGMKVPDNQIDKVVDIINSCPQVTHNYYRSNKTKYSTDKINLSLNIWFTLSTRNDKEKKNILDDISRKSQIKLYEFPKLKLFKLKVYFEMEDSKCLTN